ncbi:MAG TPA: hypothetical protein DDY68_02040 [Porphyromonadaceae bacterium]|nr:hypothetical protein [Porphyromonadaceae bacterium]
MISISIDHILYKNRSYCISKENMISGRGHHILFQGRFLASAILYINILLGNCEEKFTFAGYVRFGII